MNFNNHLELDISQLKEFLYTAKTNTFASTDKKSSLVDQTSVVTYRDFKNYDKAYAYEDKYNGNTIEAGVETVSIDLVRIWRNQYYGGVIFDIPKGVDVKVTDWAQFVVNFLKKALMNLPREFPVRGPKKFKARVAKFEDKEIYGDWSYENKWKGLSLFAKNADPIMSFQGFETIRYNNQLVYWHSYQGGILYDKYFPIKLKEDKRNEY